jgi:hypothetical protein
VKRDTRLVGDNNNKGCAPNLIIYRRLLLKTPTRAVHAITVVFPWFVPSQTINKTNSNAPNPACEAGTTIIEKTNDLKRTEAREVGET